jgi:hypothetical protein
MVVQNFVAPAALQNADQLRHERIGQGRARSPHTVAVVRLTLRPRGAAVRRTLGAEDPPQSGRVGYNGLKIRVLDGTLDPKILADTMFPE